MCRYVAYIGPPLVLSELIYKPANSLVHQATEAMRTPTRINADGFGVGWYASEISPEPAVFKDTSPVWNNYNLGAIAGKIRSSCIVAHIRSAKSYDPVTRENCHPFARGRLLWMHNGDIPGRARLARQVGLLADDPLLASLRGNTDSELAFTLFLTYLDDPFSGNPSAEELASAMERTLRQIVDWHDPNEERPLEMNFCVTNGSGMVAVRYALSERSTPSLHWRERPSGAGDGSVLIASEPLFAEDRWRSVEDGAMVVVHPDLRVEHRQLAGDLRTRGRAVSPVAAGR